MKGLLVILSVLAVILLISSIQDAQGHKYDFEEEIEDDILLQCEVHYEDFEEVELSKYLERHVHVKNTEICVELYQHPIWKTDHPARNRVLTTILHQLLPEPPPDVKERHLPTSPATIPAWVKNDAKIWSNGEHTDSRFAFSIRYMINQNIITAPTFASTATVGCEEDTLCIRPDDFVEYSFTDSFEKDVITVQHTFGDITENEIAVSSETTSKEGRVTTDFLVNLENGLTNIKNKDGEYVPYRFMYVTPLKIGSEIINPKYDLRVAAETSVPFDGRERPVLFAKDSSGDYIEVVDKETGLVLSTKYEIIEIVYFWERSKLVDTNLFEKKAIIQFKELSIPDWWKNNVVWWLAGEISDSEYISALEFLWGKNVLKI